MLRNNLNGKRIGKRLDTRITESLCCMSETNKTLLTNYTPTWNEKLKWERKKER